MQSIAIKSLTILNFKGIKKLNVDFSASETNIFGANESGKTSVWDSFNWLITGKESNDSKQFPIKRLDKDGKPIKNIDVSVEGVFVVDGEELIIKREFVENWGAEKRGSSNVIFKGNTSNYFWNNAPLKTETEFNQRIVDLFGSDDKFKLLTNPSYFSSDAFDWKKRRAIVEDLAGGELSDDVILMNNPDIESLILQLKKKSLKDIRSEATHNKKLLKDEQSKIKTRIEEAKLSKQDDVDVDAVNSQISGKQSQIDEIDKMISDANHSKKELHDRKQSIQAEIWNIESDNAKIMNDARRSFENDKSESTSKVDLLKEKIEENNREILTIMDRINDGKRYIENLVSTNQSNIEDVQSEIKTINDNIQGYREEFKLLSSQTFTINPDETFCKLCGREHEADVLNDHREKAIAKFNAEIVLRKNAINERGSKSKERIDVLTAKIAEIEASAKEKVEKYTTEVDRLIGIEKGLKETEKHLLLSLEEANNGETKKIQSIEDRLSDEYHINTGEIAKLKQSILDLTEGDTDVSSESVVLKSSLLNEITDLKSSLMINEMNKKADDRVAELQDKFTDIGQQLTVQDGILYNTDKYEHYKFNELEKRVNTKFKRVQIKMFNELQNGGFEPTCLVTYNGVPYVNGGLNTAAKITSGIDIIETLTEYYKLSLPLFLDNRESCSNIQETGLQIVNLFVSPDDKKLRIENN